MYADDTAFHVQGTWYNAIVWIASKSEHACLKLNISKRVGMFFTKNPGNNPKFIISDEKITLFKQFKYL